MTTNTINRHSQGDPADDRGRLVLTWHPLVAAGDNPEAHAGAPVEIPLYEPWVLPGSDVTVGEFRLSTREAPSA